MRWILGLLVLGAVGAGAWLLLGPSTGESSAPDEAGERAGVGARAGPTLEGAGGSGRRGATAAAQGRCAVECRVTRDGRPAAAAVEARRVGPALRPTFRWTMTDLVERMFAAPAPHGADEPGTVRVAADASGRALLTGLAPGRYLVTARSADGAEALASVALPDDGLRVRALLELRPADLALDARITWSDGRSPVGTLVLLPRAETRAGVVLMLSAGSDGAKRGEIRADGSARVEGLSALTYDVRAVLGEHLAVSGPPVTLPTKGPYVLSLTAPSAKRSGRVLEAGSDAPVPGALVTAQTAQDGRTQLLARATADADGRFTLEVVPTQGGLSAEAPGFAPTTLRNLTPAGAEVVIRLTRSARVAGRVTTADGAPAAGAVVAASTRSPDGPQRQWTATADRDGRYALEGIAAGEAQVHVRGGGWASPGLADVRPGGFNPYVVRVPAGGALTLDLAAVRAARLAGHVLDAAGAPVVGAAVAATTSAASAFSARGWSSSPGDADTTTSDALGAFTLDSLVPGAAYLLTATAPDQPQAKAGPFAAASEPSAPVEVRFGAPRWVDARVLFEGDERPAAGVRVTASASGPRGSERWSMETTQAASVTTDADGRARLGPLGEGRISLVLVGPTIALSRTPTPVEGSETGPGPFDVVVHVAPGQSIEGRVLKPDGTPAAGAQITVQAARGGNDVVSGPDGTFTLPGLPAGRHALAAFLSGPDGAYWNAAAAAEAGATGVTLTLEAGTSGAMEAFTIRVLDDAGRPVPRASVRLLAGGASSGTTVLDGLSTLRTDVGPNGSVGRALAEGRCFVEVTDARGADDLPLAVGSARVGPLAKDQREIEVRLPPELAIEGRVLTEDGANRAGVLVSASPVAKESRERGASRERPTGRSDAQGRFRIGGLADGEYTLTVAAAPDYVATPGVKVPAGTKDVEVKVRRGVSARIRVTDPAGRPVGNASVNLSPAKPGGPASGAGGAGGVVPLPAPPSLDGDGEAWDLGPDGSWRSAGPGGANVTAQDGSVLLRGLDPDLTFTLLVRPPGARDDVRLSRQDAWRPADTEVRLERGYVVSGSIRDAAGKPVAGARLLRKTGETSWSGAPTNGDGTFRVTGLEAGPVTLRASAPGAAGRQEAAPGSEITVAAGTENVVLTVDPGLSLVVKVANLADRKGEAAQGLWALLLRWEENRWTNADSQWDQQGGGSITFRGLKPDQRYAVWIAPQNDDLFGWASDVRPGELTLRLERGGSIRGRVLGPSGVTQRRVWASGEFGQSVSAHVDAEGRYELKGLPDGRWKVQAAGRSGEQSLRAEGEATVGGTLDLTLAAAPSDR